MNEKSIIDSLIDGLNAGTISSKSSTGFRDKKNFIKPKNKRYLVRKENTRAVLLILKQFALPFDNRTFKQTEELNEDTQFRPSFSPTTAIKVQMEFLKQNEDTFNRFKKLTGYTGDLSNYNGEITKELFDAFKMFLEPQDIKLPVLFINNEAITNRMGPQPYFNDFNEEEFYSLPYEEQQRIKPLWLKVQELILAKIFKDLEELEATPSYMEDTDEGKKKKRSAVFSSNPIQGQGLQHNYLAIRLDMNENGEFVDNLAEITAEELLDRMIYCKPFAKTLRPVVESFNDTMKSEDNFVDFYPIEMSVGIFKKDATGKPEMNQISEKTQFSVSSDFIVMRKTNDPILDHLRNVVTEAIDKFYDYGNIEPEKATKGWFTIQSYDQTFENRLMSNLSKQYNIDTFRRLLSEDMIDQHRDALEVLFPDMDLVYDELDNMEDPNANVLPDVTKTKAESKALLEQTVQQEEYDENEKIVDLGDEVDF